MQDSYEYSSPPPSRSGLERSLNYGGLGLRKLQTFLLNSYLVIALIWTIVFAAAVSLGSNKLAIVSVAVLALMGPPIYFFWTTFREMQKRRIDVNDAGIILDDGKTREAFAYSDVESIRFLWIPYVAFSVKFKMNDGRKLSLPTIVERLDYPLDNFANARPDLAHNASFMHYRRVAISLDHTWARLGQTMSNPGRGAVAAAGRFLFTIVCAAGITSMGQQLGWFAKIEQFSSFLLWGLDVILMSFAVWAASYAFFETRYFLASMRRLHEDPYAVKRDMRHEAEVRLLSIRWTYGVSMAMAVLVASFASSDMQQHQVREKAEQASVAKVPGEG
ncbi:MAG: hypothetical protein EOP05_15030 [Proteobacteria bacterium]|nr:MAG: hypothetical protein EOP05_15030 [Pseudomonadota bacterium]